MCQHVLWANLHEEIEVRQNFVHYLLNVYLWCLKWLIHKILFKIPFVFWFNTHNYILSFTNLNLYHCHTWCIWYGSNKFLSDKKYKHNIWNMLTVVIFCASKGLWTSDPTSGWKLHSLHKSIWWVTLNLVGASGGGCPLWKSSHNPTMTCIFVRFILF